MKDDSRISVGNYFEGRSIFITGVTGFVGKVLLEKLLRSCGSIDRIYVLIRPLKGKSPEERLEQLLQSSIFSLLRKKSETIFQKVILISGDVTCENLGISNENKEMLLDKVSIVFHVAATVKFTESIMTAMRMNFVGALRVLELSKAMKKLVSIVHVSTAYSNADRHKEIIQETTYPPPIDPQNVMEWITWLDGQNILDEITPKLLGEKPNTYIFSKQLTECLLERKAKEWNLPICIVRPSIVGSIYKDPISLEGWVDNLSAISWMVYCLGHGLQYAYCGIPSNCLDVLPVDYLAKVMILAAWDMGMTSGRNKNSSNVNNSCNNKSLCIPDSNFIRVYNACVHEFNPIHIHDVNLYLNKGLEKTPFSRILRPGRVRLTSSQMRFNFLNRFYCGLVCMFMDLKNLVCFQKPKMMKTYWRVEKSFVALSYFTFTNIHFSSDNVKHLRSKILPEDAVTFDLTMEEIDWEDYLGNLVHGIRRYYDKDDDSTIPKAVKHRIRVEAIFSAIEMFIIASAMSIGLLALIYYDM